MKRLLVVVVVLFVFPVVVQADYKEQLAKDMSEIMTDFRKEQVGQTLTSFVLEGLLVRINKAFIDNTIPVVEKKTEKE